MRVLGLLEVLEQLHDGFGQLGDVASGQQLVDGKVLDQRLVVLHCTHSKRHGEKMTQPKKLRAQHIWSERRRDKEKEPRKTIL